MVWLISSAPALGRCLRLCLPLIVGYNLRPRPVLGAETPANPAQAHDNTVLHYSGYIRRRTEQRLLLATSVVSYSAPALDRCLRLCLPLIVGYNLRPRPVLVPKSRLPRHKAMTPYESVAVVAY